MSDLSQRIRAGVRFWLPPFLFATTAVSPPRILVLPRSVNLLSAAAVARRLCRNIQHQGPTCSREPRWIAAMPIWESVFVLTLHPSTAFTIAI